MAAAALMAGVVTAPSAAASPGVPAVKAVGGLDCPAVVADESSAVATAAVCGRSVEVLAERDEWQSVFAQPDGTMRLEVSAVALRTQVNGEWEPVDTTLVAAADGVKVAAPAVAMTFSDGAEGLPLVRMVRDGHELVFDVPFDLPEPLVYGSALEYADVLPGVDLVVQVDEDGTGFSEVLRVASPQAAADPRLAELAFPLEVSGGLEVAEVEGGFTATDTDGEVVFRAPAPMMWDSAADAGLAATTPALAAGSLALDTGAAPAAGAGANGAARLEGPLGGDRVAVMPLELADEAVQVTPAAEMLADPATAWPVYIDPSVTTTLADWTTISSAGWIHYRYTGDDGLGHCDRLDFGCSSVFTSRMAWEFGWPAGLGRLTRSEVVSATFKAWGTHSYNCVRTPVEAWRVGGFTSHTGWPWVVMTPGYLDSRNVAHRTSCSAGSLKPQWVEWNVTEAVRQVGDENRTAVAIGLQADNETDMTGWKRYRNDAQLSIEYNRRPADPTGMRTTNPPTGCVTGASRPFINSTTPTLWANVADVDSEYVYARFDAFDLHDVDVAGDDEQVWEGGDGVSQVAPGTFERPVPAGELVNGHHYRWTVQGWDGRSTSPTTKSCEFTVDTEPPVVPTVSPESGTGLVTYPEGAVSGGPGQAGRFALGNGGSADVVSYRYSFDDELLTQSVTGPSASVPFAPASTDAGPHWLRVQSVDRAGNVSTIRAYRFIVGLAGTVASWFLDEGTGTTAMSASPVDLPLSASTATWVDGPLAEFGIDPADRARRFHTTSEAAQTTSAVVATDRPFSVVATVKLDSLAADATAVSQDGATRSGFELGYLQDAGCADPGGCWAFSLLRAPGAPGEPRVAATSAVPVEADAWVGLTGVFDGQQVTLHVCTLGGEPEASSPTPFQPGWAAQGPFQVGRGLFDGLATNPWSGDVADVRLYDGVISSSAIWQNCNPA